MVSWAYLREPQRHLDRFSRFCGARERDHRTGQTVYATPYVAIGRYRQLSLRCGLIIIIIMTSSQNNLARSRVALLSHLVAANGFVRS